MQEIHIRWLRSSVVVPLWSIHTLATMCYVTLLAVVKSRLMWILRLDSIEKELTKAY